jgi:hypothetical protein
MKTHKTIAASFAALFALAIAYGAIADVTGEFNGVSFRASNGGKSVKPSGGNGTLKNEKGSVVAQGDLKPVDKTMTSAAKKDATFVHAVAKTAFPADSFSSDPVMEFAAVEFGDGNQWTIKDDKFVFVLEVPNLNQPRIVVALDKSLARASVITLPKGKFNLWGYPIEVSKGTGIVKFRHGSLINMTDASFDDTDTRHMLLYDKNGQLNCIGKQKLGFGGGLSGMFDGATLLIGEGAGGDRALTVQNGENGPIAVGGFITNEGDRVVFDDKGKVTSRIGGFWKPQSDSVYAISLRDADGKDLAIARLTKEVRWDINGEVTKGADAFVEVGLKSPDNKEGKYSKVIESKCEKGVVTIMADGGLTLQISGFSYDHKAEAKRIK